MIKMTNNKASKSNKKFGLSKKAPQMTKSEEFFDIVAKNFVGGASYCLGMTITSAIFQKVFNHSAEEE